MERNDRLVVEVRRARASYELGRREPCEVRIEPTPTT